MAKRKVLFDIEGNGLVRTITKIWLVVAKDLDTGETFIFSDVDKDGTLPLSELPSFLDDCHTLIAHNQMMYDLLVLEKLLGWKPKSTTTCYDTMIMSQVLNYKRFGFGHSLARWGEFLGFPKVEHDEWDRYSPEMRTRCIVDVELNILVYNYLLKEFLARKNKDLLKIGLKAEHGVSRFVGRSVLHGWPFDIEKGQALLTKLEDEMKSISDIINPMLRLKIAQVDRINEVKEPKWVRNGDYAVRTASWFGFEPSRGQDDDRPIWGDYCRVEVVQPDIGSMESVKELLFSLGWEPDEYNYVKNDKGALVQSTPKLTDFSLEPLGEVGEMIGRFYSLRARHSILHTWCTENYDPNTGRIYGDCFVIGTPTGRARHQVIANIPSADALYGPEMRSLFFAEPGYSIVGADSKGNQNRALAHYLNNEHYTSIICDPEGDVHNFNKGILESIVGPMGPSGRKKAKAFFYALIFAGGAGKLALIVTGKRDAAVGARIKDEFLRKIPGLSKLVSDLERQFKASQAATGKGYIFALDGRPIFMEGARLALNYLLQSFEKITVSLAITQLMEELDEGGYDWQPLIFYHDESQIMVASTEAEVAKEICIRAYKEAPNQLGVSIMAGSADIGRNWAECH